MRGDAAQRVTPRDPRSFTFGKDPCQRRAHKHRTRNRSVPGLSPGTHRCIQRFASLVLPSSRFPSYFLNHDALADGIPMSSVIIPSASLVAGWDCRSSCWQTCCQLLLDFHFFLAFINLGSPSHHICAKRWPVAVRDDFPLVPHDSSRFIFYTNQFPAHLTVPNALIGIAYCHNGVAFLAVV